MTPTNDGRLEVLDVSVHFGGLHALKNVSATAKPGSVLGIVGPNGAGKTTFFNVISGIVKASHGSITLDGVQLNRMSPHQRAWHGLSRTFQNLALYDEMTALENVLMGTQRWVPTNPLQMMWEGVTRRSEVRETKSRQAAEAVMSTLGLDADAHRLVTELPFGTRRRVDLARALSGAPKILLWDEPFSGLGVKEKPLMIETIQKLKADSIIGLILVEHDMTVVTELCDELMVLNEGAIIAAGKPQSVLADAHVQEAYLGPKLQRRKREVSK